MARCFKDSPGQSLVEVVVAVGAMSLLLISLLSLVVLSIKNSRMAKNRTQAVALAQEGVELMRTYRDYSWTEFSSNDSSGEYALVDNWVVGDGLGAACAEMELISDLFQRCVRVELSGSDEAEVAIRVSWQEGNQSHQTLQTTKLSIWER